ncbi:ABC transporter substrate-binding protein [Limobrevibacterium gyesilva]|uniref:ABC transporter substrate-binding protein n=1 Tax=Limobrevibacterium gyesilva TaxID=2991712 RepID=A0AA41YHC5_9PROT|nr:ABC transporter substrate-binding protein [Limobrevibacterium gyesilva]MCW3473294.1 ABC transporter substrate-binding protein [Limobrevibacterium gyesilva]
MISRRQLGALAGAAALSPALAAHAEEPRRGGRLNLIVQPEPASAFIGINRLGPSAFVGSKINEGLLSFGRDLKPRPMLAESWEVSPDGLTYVFRLRRNAAWHDGRPFTSADVVYSITEFLPKVFSRSRAVFTNVDRVTAVDAHTVELKMKHPFPGLLTVFERSGGTMVPRHIYEGTDPYRNPANEKPIGTGPFKFAEWRRGSFIRLERNENYWQPDRPYLDEIYFHVVPDANGRSVAFETGQVDVLRGGDVEWFEVRRLARLPEVEVTEAGWEFLSPLAWFNLNLRNPPLNDVRFRRALSHAIDRNFIVRTIFAGFGTPCDGPMTRGMAFSDPAAWTTYKYDTRAAIALLDEMGLRPGRDGIRAELRFLPLPYGETWLRLGDYLRERLRAIGIRLNVTPVDMPTLVQRVNAGDFDIFSNFVYMLPDPAMNFTQVYRSDMKAIGTSSNLGGYDNPELTAMLLRAERTQDRAERQRLYTEIQKILTRDVPILWTHEIGFLTLHRKKVRNLMATGLGTDDTLADTWLAG